MAIVGIVHHPKRENARLKAAELESWLRGHHHEAIHLGDDPVESQLDLVISLGGDGTMLRAIDHVMPLAIPVLGVNFGSLGYLTEVDPDSLYNSLDRFFDGDYLIEERMTLLVSVVGERDSKYQKNDARDEDTTETHFVALNEVVVEKLSSGHVIRVDVSIGSEQFLVYEADGLIVSTPTGSTAYSFSARGPVVSPNLRALVVTPISPHMLFDRSLVLDPVEELSLRLAEGPPAAVMVDGVEKVTIVPGDIVTCSANPTPAYLVNFSKRDFHQILKMKFGLTSKRMGE